MAQQARQESEFIKRVEDFARYMAPEYITDSENPRSLTIIAADCLDAKSGKHAMAHIMVGNDRVGRCALRSMMEDNDKFAAQVHELCDVDGADRSIEDLDEEIGRKQKQLHNLYIVSALSTAWMLALVVFLITGFGNRLISVSSIFLMLAVFVNLYGQIRPLRFGIASLRQQRKRAASRQNVVNHIAQFGELLRRMSNMMGADDEDDE